jgi:hypothetical protein
MKFIIRTYLFLFLVLSITSCTEKNKSNQQTQTNQSPDNKKIDVVQPEDVVTPPNLPPLGKWMYTSEKKYSDWLGEKLNGKTLREPVNIVIVDSISKSADDAKNLLIKNFKLAGFEIRSGHSGGYLGFIEKMLYTQLPDKPDHAFADKPFEEDNNHGRIFGPCLINGVYYFTGAFSREKVVVNIPVHQFVSFNAARIQLSENLNTNSTYKLAGKVDMKNRLETESITTGDCDGKAILLSAAK